LRDNDISSHFHGTSALFQSFPKFSKPPRTQRAGLKEGTPCKELVYIFNGDICVSWAFLGAAVLNLFFLFWEASNYISGVISGRLKFWVVYPLVMTNIAIENGYL